MSALSFRRDLISKPIFRWAQQVLPTLSDTEREAIEAGDVWWDADLFSGNPDWAKLLAVPPATLSPEEQAFSTAPSTSSAVCSTSGASPGSCAISRPKCGTFSSAANSSR